MSKPNRQQLLGVLLVSMGALALEIILTRVFSVTMWYHFAFMVIVVPGKLFCPSFFPRYAPVAHSCVVKTILF